MAAAGLGLCPPAAMGLQNMTVEASFGAGQSRPLHLPPPPQSTYCVPAACVYLGLILTPPSQEESSLCFTGEKDQDSERSGTLLRPHS